MTHNGEQDKRRFWALARRYNQLGVLLPKIDDLDTEDIGAVASARMVLAEMAVVKNEIDAILARNDPRRPAT